MFVDLSAAEIQPATINGEIREITLSEELRKKIKAVFEEEGVDAKIYASTSVVKPDNNYVFFSNHWYYLAILCKDYAQALYPYCRFFDERIRNNTEIITNLANGYYKDLQFLNLFSDDTDREYMIRFITADPDFRPGKALINKRDGDRIAVRSCRDIFGSCVLKKVAVPDASSGFLGDVIYYLAKHRDLFEELQKEIKAFFEAPLISVVEEGGESEMENDSKLKTCLEILRAPRENTLHPLNLIIYGAPGTGKTYSTAEYALAIIENRPVDTSRKTSAERKTVMKQYNDFISKGQVVFTTFHQSYGYEEFIQGLRPDTKAGNMAFKTVDGVFKHIADIALNDSDNNYVIIIDEINRANISKVFGELITLIEEDKRWGEVNETCATLQSGDVFAVPNNLYIVGTMNSADKSISLIDAALRRRFEFIEQHPDETLVDDLVLRGVMKKLNEQLADALESSDLLIGHSYFMGKDKDALCTIMNNSIIPLLYEYFYDNKKKVINVLEECLKGLDVEIKDDKISRVYIVKAQAEADA